MIIYVKDENKKSEKKYKKYKRVTTKTKSFDTFDNIAKTSTSSTLSVTRICSRVIPKSIGLPFGLTSSNKVRNEIVIQKIMNMKNVIREHNKL